MKKIALGEISKHNTESDCWVVVHGAVIDVTNFLQTHPGGVSALSKPGRGGCDVTEHFERIGHSEKARGILRSMQIGVVDDFKEVENEGTSESTSLLVDEDLEKSRSRDSIDQEKEHAIRWHALRRRAMLQDHPEIAELMGSDPSTLLIGLGTVFVHSLACCYAQLHTTPWYWTFLLAYTIGAVCKMYQFAINHDICHGTAGSLLEKYPILKGLAMQVCTLPAVGGPMHTYYEFQHIGHHSSLGVQALSDLSGGNAREGAPAVDFLMRNLRSFFFFPDGDGDLLAIGTFSMGKLKGLGGDNDDMHLLHYFHGGMNKILKCLIVQVGHFFHHSAFDLLYIYGLAVIPPISIPLFLFPDKFRDLILYLMMKSESASKVLREHPENIKLLFGVSIRITASVGIHAWLGLLLNIWLMFYNPLASTYYPQSWTIGSVLKGIMYLYFSELFLYGFLMHPFMGYFLGVHRSGGTGFEVDPQRKTPPQTLIAMNNNNNNNNSSNDTFEFSSSSQLTKDCQPTMSTYCPVASFASLNLTYHVEHHDFPNVPWSRLPQIRKLAPEYYDYLEQSPGFYTTIYRWIHHSGSWGYACQ